MLFPPIEGDERLGGEAKRRGCNRPNNGLTREERHHFGGTRGGDQQLTERSLWPRRAKTVFILHFLHFRVFLNFHLFFDSPKSAPKQSNKQKCSPRKLANWTSGFQRFNLIRSASNVGETAKCFGRIQSSPSRDHAPIIRRTKVVKNPLLGSGNGTGCVVCFVVLLVHLLGEKK